MSYDFYNMEKYQNFNYKEINQNEERNKIIKDNFKLEIQSEITRLIAIFPSQIGGVFTGKNILRFYSSFYLFFRIEKKNKLILYSQYLII